MTEHRPVSSVRRRPGLWLLLVLLLTLGAAPARAASGPDPELWKAGLPEGLLPLLRHTPENLDAQTGHEAARLLARKGFTALASRILEQNPQPGSTPEGLLTLARIAASRGQADKVAEHTGEFLTRLGTQAHAGEDAAGLEAELVELLRWLRERGAGNGLAEPLAALAAVPGEWPRLRVEARLWARQTQGYVRSDTQARHEMEHCATASACVAWMDYFSAVGEGESRRLALMRARRATRNATDRDRVIRAAAAQGLGDEALPLLADWLADAPPLAAIAGLAADLPKLWPTIRTHLLEQAQEADSRQRWQLARIAWAHDDMEWLHHLLPEEADSLSGSEELLEAVTTLNLIGGSTRPLADTEVWRRRLNGLLVRVERMNLGPETACALLFRLNGTAPDSHGSLRALARTLAESGTEFGTLMAGVALLRAGDSSGARQHLAAFWDTADRTLGAAQWIVALWRESSTPVAELRGALTTHLRTGIDTPQDLIDRFVLADLLHDRDLLAALLREGGKIALGSRERLTLFELAFRQRLYVEARRLLLGLPGELPPDVALAALNAWFSLNAHEEAIRLSYRLETDESLEPLVLARLLAIPYRNWRDGLMGVQRRTRVSLDIYTQLIIRTVRRHLDAEPGRPEWAEAVTILQELEAIPRLDDPLTDPALRLAFHQARQDLDAAVFEVYQRFMAAESPDTGGWADVLRALCRVDNPDFIRVAWDALKGLSLDPEPLAALSLCLAARPHGDLGDLTDEVLGRWRQSLRGDSPDNQLLRMAFWMTALAGEDASRSRARRQPLTGRIEALEQVIVDYKGLEQQIADGQESLTGARISLIERTGGNRESSADMLRDAVDTRRWIVENCLGAYDPKGDNVIRISLITDSLGRVERARVSDLPADAGLIRSCIETRLGALTVEGVDPPFGHVELALTLKPLQNDAGTNELLTDPLAPVRRERRRLENAVQQLRDEIDCMETQVAARRSLADRLALAAVARSWDAAVYHEAAWWLEHVAEDAKAADLLRRQARWIALAGWLPWLGLCALAGWAGRRLWHRRRRGRQP